MAEFKDLKNDIMAGGFNLPDVELQLPDAPVEQLPPHLRLDALPRRPIPPLVEGATDLVSALAHAAADKEAALQRRLAQMREERDALARVLDTGRRECMQYSFLVEGSAAQLGEYPDTPEAIREGLQVLALRVHDISQALGLERFAPQAGDPVVPHLHRISGLVEAEGVEPGRIARVIRPGFMQAENVHEPALVEVAASSAPSDASFPP